MAKFGIGQAVRRVEDARFITGSGRYVDDIVLPGMAHGANVLSPHAHARIKRVDATKAKGAPGVLLVLTGAESLGIFLQEHSKRETPATVCIVAPTPHTTLDTPMGVC